MKPIKQWWIGVVLVAAFFSVTIAGCSDESEENRSGGEADEDVFLQQPHWQEYVRQADESPYDPERSEWDRVEALEQSERLAPEALCTNPDTALEAWAESRYLIGPAQDADLEINMRTRVLRDGSMEGLLQRWGFKDDSVAGTDHRVRFTRADECWQIEEVVARHYCRRGVSEGLICR
ncbi:hypothetical protein J2T60_000193 [Natronospira proteinivora]|uniref:Lipoprotein n=1 Tax=Natronospira proteinivora TaxID=1807133 RepID=A0ABT1G785_9GAMM|nr:hypothetical protein [Natronospira proteinivora]MCP1726228.1 hypothetical protein [Natronospira proteinivora]